MRKIKKEKLIISTDMVTDKYIERDIDFPYLVNVEIFFEQKGKRKEREHLFTLNMN